MSEQQIEDIFSRVGQVLNFRLVHDKETGRPKGFGFLEYADPDAAASAVRNLNDHEIMGRKLRVDWSNDNSGGGGGGGDGGQQNQQSNVMDGQGQQSGAIPQLPAGVDLPAGLTCPDAISKTLSVMPTPQLLDMVSQVKSLVVDNPAQALTLFQQAPQFTYATFQALLLLGLVDANTLGAIIQGSNPQAQTAAPPAAPLPQPQYAPPPQAAYPGYPPHMQQQMHVPTPPAQQPVYQPPPAQPAPAQLNDPNAQALIRQVMAMTAEQIHAIPDMNTRSQLITLRAQLGAPV